MAASTYIARSTKAIVLGLALAALAASAAQASQPVVPDAIDRYLANHQSHAVAPDDRAGIRGVASQAVVPDAIDRYLANHQSRSVERYLSPDDRAGLRGVPNLGEPSLLATTEQSVGDGFDWSDAGIGAASSSFVSLLAGLALLILVRRRQHA